MDSDAAGFAGVLADLLDAVAVFFVDWDLAAVLVAFFVEPAFASFIASP
jgi:hypothetical protein